MLDQKNSISRKARNILWAHSFYFLGMFRFRKYKKIYFFKEAKEKLSFEKEIFRNVFVIIFETLVFLTKYKLLTRYSRKFLVLNNLIVSFNNRI